MGRDVGQRLVHQQDHLLGGELQGVVGEIAIGRALGERRGLLHNDPRLCSSVPEGDPNLAAEIIGWHLSEKLVDRCAQ